jgi:hypothetical protein
MVRYFVATGMIAIICAPLAAAVNGEEPVHAQHKAQRATAVAWDSPDVRKMWAVAQASVPAHDNRAKSWYTREREFLEHALTEKFSKEELHALASSCDTMPYGDEAREFPYAVYLTLQGWFIGTGDREGLITLLAAHFEPYSLSETTEGLLVSGCGTESLLTTIDALDKGPAFRRDVERALVRGYDEAAIVDKKHAALVKKAVDWYEKHRRDRYIGSVLLTDPILIVTEAYSRSKLPKVREKIAGALRHAFRGFGVSGKTDDEFIANAARWYLQHKDRLWFNDSYMDHTGLDDESLFLLEPEAEGPAEGLRKR